jgi:hypothetical protein
MRKGIHNSGFITRKKGRIFVGINLGSDFCAEHEWGFDITKRAFGIAPPETSFGIDRRKVRRLPEEFVWLATPKYQGFWLKSWSEDKEPRDVSFSGATLWTGWSDGSFGAFSTDPDEQASLQSIYQAINGLDAALFLGGRSGLFDNPGFIIAMPSRMATEELQAMAKADREQYELKRDAERTGIEKRLRDAGRRFFALSPRRKEDGSIVFWLNPFEQHLNNFGWYTVAELDAWIRGEGPIPKHRAKGHTKKGSRHA